MRRALIAACLLPFAAPALAEVNGPFDPSGIPGVPGTGNINRHGWQRPARAPAAEPAVPSASGPQTAAPKVLDGGPRPAISASAPPTVAFPNGYGSGTVIVDTAGRQLFYVLSSTRAYRYPISVGREGFQWAGTERISRVASWPDWRPPAEMRQRDPRLPELMTGGLNNPLGAKALYLGSTLYRIHGTNNAGTIGYAASSGCFRMHNSHVEHLSRLAGVGTKVVVLRGLPKSIAASVKRTGDQG